VTLASDIAKVESSAPNPSKGLPEELFLFATRITPMLNVDLLIKDAAGRTLLTWREDGFWEPGWHIPGGIIRFKETAAERIRAVALSELGTEVAFAPAPLCVKEFIYPQFKNRGHFVSLLYRCELAGEPSEGLKHREGKPKHGFWAWHEGCPERLLEPHENYRDFISLKAPGGI